MFRRDGEHLRRLQAEPGIASSFSSSRFGKIEPLDPIEPPNHSGQSNPLSEGSLSMGATPRSSKERRGTNVDLNPRTLRSIRSSLMRWYDRERRALPWRERTSPYRTVVSEFMLQQTQVATVLPYFKSFVRRFPSFRALSRATEEEVLAAWSGLGYYRRARSLKGVADVVTRQYGGRLPRSAEELRALNGFGEYTTAAVGSIVHGLALGAVDGNVHRVLARLFAVGGDKGDRAISDLAQSLLHPRRPGDWNQAMMELGAMVCAARDPRCGRCPLRRRCMAFGRDAVSSFPSPRPQPAVEQVQEVVVAPVRRGKALVLQRGDAAPFALMWELPRMDSRELGTTALSPERVLFDRTQLSAGSFKYLGRTQSSFTRFRITARLYAARALATGSIKLSGHVRARWVALAELRSLAASGPQKRLFEMLQ